MLILAILAGCGTQNADPGTPDPPPRDTGPTEVIYPEMVPGTPQVGAAEGALRLPLGTPMAGYTSRCLFGLGRQDARDSAYIDCFVASTGVQTYPGIKVIWLSNGDDHLVLTKTDSIYSFDGLVTSLTQKLEAQTGIPLKGRVIHTANHSHNSYGTFSDAVTFYLGSDTFHRENFERMVDQIADVAIQAHDSLQPGQVGVGWHKDWDPAGEIYSDRRGENDALHVWPDAEPGMGKDPYLGLIRFDDAAGEPVAVVVNFGMHGIIGDDFNPMISTDSGGHLETYLQEAFDDRVVVMFAQGGGGDSSPRGRDENFARMESIGALATERIKSAIDGVTTSDAPIQLDSVSRHIPIDLESARVTRNGTVDWRYLPYDEDRIPDDVVYNPDGSLASPLDEFNVEFGALFCGSGFPGLSGMASQAPGYTKCAPLAVLAPFVEPFFTLPDGFPLPTEDSLRAGTTVTRLGPVPTLLPDGRQVDQDLLLGFFPGEATAMYTEQWRRRVKAELGDEQAMMISYAQDHEGYLLIPEDWLVGGYEPDISIWGPLGGEHTMEGVLLAANEVLSTSVRENPDPKGLYTPTQYEDKPFEVHTPDRTPKAGTLLATPPDYLWTHFYDDQPVPPAALMVPDEVPRVQGIVQLAWEGGDPAVDNPRVVLQRQEGSDWVDVTTRTGRTVDDTGHSILLAHTPFPLQPYTATQSHQYWAAWQAVGHVHDKASLEEGTYRLHVEGQYYSGDEDHWPYSTTPYTFDSDTFELVPAELTIAPIADPKVQGFTVSLVAPDLGYRLIGLNGSSVGDNPPVGPFTVTIERQGQPDEVFDVDTEGLSGAVQVLVDLGPSARVVVVDAAGNSGEFTR